VPCALRDVIMHAKVCIRCIAVKLVHDISAENSARFLHFINSDCCCGMYLLIVGLVVSGDAMVNHELYVWICGVLTLFLALCVEWLVVNKLVVMCLQFRMMV
jgi:hypothetical protein